jgi:hypothetical protein
MSVYGGDQGSEAGHKYLTQPTALKLEDWSIAVAQIYYCLRQSLGPVEIRLKSFRMKAVAVLG